VKLATSAAQPYVTAAVDVAVAAAESKGIPATQINAICKTALAADPLFGAFVLGNSLVGTTTGSQSPALKNPTYISPQGSQQPTSEVVVCSGSGCPGYQSAANSFVFNWIVQPAFGWIDCATSKCSAGQELYLFTGPIRLAGAGGVVGKLGSVALGSVSSQGAQAALLATMRQGGSDAFVSLAQDLGVDAADGVEALVQEAPALESFLERGAEAAEALAESAGP
jgi:hypothetical protein